MERYTIKDFLEIKHTHNPSWSPDGKKVAFLSNETGVHQLYLVGAAGGKPQQLTRFNEPISSAEFSPACDEIVFASDQGGNERVQLFLHNVKKRSTRPLTRNTKAKHNFGGFSRDGRFLAYSSNERNGKDFDVYVLNRTSGARQRVCALGGWCVALGFSPDDKQLLVRKRHTTQDHDLYVVARDGSASKRITPRGKSSKYLAAAWLPDSSGLIIAANYGKDFVGVAHFDLARNKIEYKLNPPWDLEEIALSRDGKKLAIIINEAGISTLTIYDTRAWREIARPHLPKGIIKGVRWDPQGERLTMALEGSPQPSAIWIVNVAPGSARQLTKNISTVPRSLFVAPKINHFQSFDGLKIPVFAYLPRRSARARLPAIIYLHGGPEAQFRPGFNAVIQFFAYSGYAVLAPNIRGSTGYGARYAASDNQKKRFNAIKDLKALHRWLTHHPRVDAKRLALMGQSYGGYMVLAGLAFQPKLWSAGVDIVGIANFVTFLKNTAPWRRALREAEYGNLARDKKLLKDLSPIHKADQIKAPLLVIHGRNDPRVPLHEAQQIVEKIKARGRPVELLVYDDEGHGLKKLKNRLDAYPKIVDFLDQYLKGK